MPHGTNIVYKTGCRDLGPKRLGTTDLDEPPIDLVFKKFAPLSIYFRNNATLPVISKEVSYSL